MSARDERRGESLLTKPLIPLPRTVTLSFLCVPCCTIVPVLVFRSWNHGPGQLAGLAGAAIGLLVALFFSSVGFALAFAHAHGVSGAGTARTRWIAFLALALNMTPWIYVLVGVLRQL